MTEADDFVAGMKRQVGWFVLIGIGALVLVIVMVSLRSNIFAQKFSLFVEPPSASAFYEGQPVKFQGFNIGHIDDIQLQHQGQVRIRLRLLERYHHMLHQGAIVHFVKEGLIGEQIVEITAGNPEEPPLDDGQLLTYETEASIEQLLVDLKPAVNNANILLEEMAKLSVWMSDPYGSLQTSFANLQKMTAGVNGDTIDASLTELQATLTALRQLTQEMNQEKLVAHAGAALQATEQVMQQVKPLSQGLVERMPETLKKLDALLVQVQALSKELTVASGDLTQLTPELPGVAQELKGTLVEMKRTLRKLQGSWIMGDDKSHQQPVDTLEIAPPVLEAAP